MRKEPKWNTTTKNQLNTNEGSNGGNEEGKAIRHIEKNSKMAEANSSLSVISLNVNRVNSVIKRHRLTEWMKKLLSNYMLPTRDSF